MFIFIIKKKKKQREIPSCQSILQGRHKDGALCAHHALHHGAQALPTARLLPLLHQIHRDTPDARGQFT